MRDPMDNTLSPEAVRMFADNVQRDPPIDSADMMHLSFCILRSNLAWLVDSHETLRQQKNQLAQKINALKPIIAAAKDYRDAKARCSDDGSVQARMAEDTAYLAEQQLLRAILNTDDLDYLYL